MARIAREAGYPVTHLYRHTRESGYPVIHRSWHCTHWIPASAGMTDSGL